MTEEQLIDAMRTGRIVLLKTRVVGIERRGQRRVGLAYGQNELTAGTLYARVIVDGAEETIDVDVRALGLADP